MKLQQSQSPFPSRRASSLGSWSSRSRDSDARPAKVDAGGRAGPEPRSSEREFEQRDKLFTKQHAAYHVFDAIIEGALSNYPPRVSAMDETQLRFGDSCDAGSTNCAGGVAAGSARFARRREVEGENVNRRRNRNKTAADAMP